MQLKKEKLAEKEKAAETRERQLNGNGNSSLNYEPYGLGYFEVGEGIFNIMPTKRIFILPILAGVSYPQ